MLEKLLFYVHGFQRYEFYNVILLGSTISRKTHALLLTSASVFDLEFIGITKAKHPNEAIF